jgi:hypothetical protein
VTPADIERQFPDWHAWRGVSGLWYARRPRSSPPLVCRNTSADGLRCQLIYMEGRLADRYRRRP